MKNKLVLLALSCCSSGIYAEELYKNELTVVASYDLSGNELWDGYFSPDDIVLVEPLEEDHTQANYINHPPYNAQVGVVHRLVCDRGNEEEQTKVANASPPVVIGPSGPRPCRHGFSHVHVNDPGQELRNKARKNVPDHPHLSDYDLVSQFANRTCNEYDFDAVPFYYGPMSFVGINNESSNSHYFDYNLTQGVSFDCVLQ